MTATSSATAHAAPASANIRGWSRKEMAKRLADDIPEGWYVNLGIGIPLAVGDFIPADREVILQSENGILGMGPLQTGPNLDTWIVNAGKQNVTLKTGASIVSHSDSFAMIRGGHLDLCVLGSFEVASNGDFANWTVSLKSVPAVGGAMDLAVGAKRIWLIMEHTSKDGKPRLLEKCTMPLTAPGVVKRVYTNLAVVDVTPKGFELVSMNPEITFEALQARTGAKLHRK
ncbi:MAG: 3-oxoacid CoA-transferase subunit B [Proteobacteria bacterium]|nr:3-oxoacid CoA-transferase subunit B [Pseudomonadota bacterium]